MDYETEIANLKVDVQELAEKVENVTQPSEIRISQKVTEAMLSLLNNISQVQDNLDNSVEQINGNISNVSEQVDYRANETRDYVDGTMESVLEYLNNSVVDAKEQVDDKVRFVEERIDTMEDSVSDALTSVDEKVIALTTEVDEKISSLTGNVTEQIRQTRDSVNSAVDYANHILDTTVASLNEQINNFEASTSTIIAESQTVIQNNINQTSAELNQRVGELTDRYDTTISDLDEKFSNQIADIEDVLDDALDGVISASNVDTLGVILADRLDRDRDTDTSITSNNGILSMVAGNDNVEYLEPTSRVDEGDYATFTFEVTEGRYVVATRGNGGAGYVLFGEDTTDGEYGLLVGNGILSDTVVAPEGVMTVKSYYTDEYGNQAPDRNLCLVSRLDTLANGFISAINMGNGAITIDGKYIRVTGHTHFSEDVNLAGTMSTGSVAINNSGVVLDKDGLAISLENGSKIKYDKEGQHFVDSLNNTFAGIGRFLVGSAKNGQYVRFNNPWDITPNINLIPQEITTYNSEYPQQTIKVWCYPSEISNEGFKVNTYTSIDAGAKAFSDTGKFGTPSSVSIDAVNGSIPASPQALAEVVANIPVPNNVDKVSGTVSTTTYENSVMFENRNYDARYEYSPTDRSVTLRIASPLRTFLMNNEFDIGTTYYPTEENVLKIFKEHNYLGNQTGTEVGYSKWCKLCRIAQINQSYQEQDKIYFDTTNPTTLDTYWDGSKFDWVFTSQYFKGGGWYFLVGPDHLDTVMDWYDTNDRFQYDFHNRTPEEVRDFLVNAFHPMLIFHRLNGVETVYINNKSKIVNKTYPVTYYVYPEFSLYLYNEGERFENCLGRSKVTSYLENFNYRTRLTGYMENDQNYFDNQRLADTDLVWSGSTEFGMELIQDGTVLANSTGSRLSFADVDIRPNLPLQVRAYGNRPSIEAYSNTGGTRTLISSDLTIPTTGTSSTLNDNTGSRIMRVTTESGYTDFPYTLFAPTTKTYNTYCRWVDNIVSKKLYRVSCRVEEINISSPLVFESEGEVQIADGSAIFIVTDSISSGYSVE